MKINQHLYRVFVLLTLLVCQSALADTVFFSGQIDTVIVDNGQSLFSNEGVGSSINGNIDDELAEGEISLGAVNFTFDCCDAAGGIETTNNLELDASAAELLNQLSGSQQFEVGDIVDILDAEGDNPTGNNSRVEVGVSFVLFNTAFDEDEPYTLDPADLRLAIAFVLEEAMNFDVFLAYSSVSVTLLDTDGDGVSDTIDNCTNTTNPDQEDSNGDGIGNACDADIDNNCVVNFLDFQNFPAAFGSALGDANFNPDLDINSDGIIAFLDLGIYPAQFGGSPGPSATPCTTGAR